MILCGIALRAAKLAGGFEIVRQLRRIERRRVAARSGDSLREHDRRD